MDSFVKLLCFFGGIAIVIGMMMNLMALGMSIIDNVVGKIKGRKR